MQCRSYLADYAPLIRQELRYWEKSGIHNDLLDRSRDANVNPCAPPSAVISPSSASCMAHACTLHISVIQEGRLQEAVAASRHQGGGTCNPSTGDLGYHMD